MKHVDQRLRVTGSNESKIARRNVEPGHIALPLHRQQLFFECP